MCVFVSSLFFFSFFLNFPVSDFKDVDTIIWDRFVVIFEISLKEIKMKELFEKYSWCNEMIFFYLIQMIYLLSFIFSSGRHWSVNYFAYKNCFLVHARVSITLIPAGDRNVLSISNRSICISDIGKFWNLYYAICRLFKIERFLDRMQGTIL